MTRSKTNKLKRRLEEQTQCPISLEEFTASSRIFVHDGVKFDAFQLQNYLLKSPDATNPISRSKFTDSDLHGLDVVCNNGQALLKGAEAIYAGNLIRQQECNLSYLEGELQNVLQRHLILYSPMQSDFASLADNVCQIRQDICRYGVGEWTSIAARAIVYCSQYPAYCFNVKHDIELLLNPKRHPLTPLPARQYHETDAESEESGYDSGASDESSEQSFDELASVLGRGTRVSPPFFTDRQQEQSRLREPVPPYTPFSEVFNILRTPLPSYATGFYNSARLAGVTQNSIPRLEI